MFSAVTVSMTVYEPEGRNKIINVRDTDCCFRNTREHELCLIRSRGGSELPALRKRKPAYLLRNPPIRKSLCIPWGAKVSYMAYTWVSSMRVSDLHQYLS